MGDDRNNHYLEKIWANRLISESTSAYIRWAQNLIGVNVTLWGVLQVSDSMELNFNCCPDFPSEFQIAQIVYLRPSSAHLQLMKSLSGGVQRSGKK
jgi:hypothetical protein